MPTVTLGHAKGGPSARDAQVTRHRYLKPGAQAPAGKAGDDRRRAGPDRFAQCGQPAYEGLGGDLVQPCHLVDVRAANECLVAGTAQNDDPAVVLA